MFGQFGEVESVKLPRGDATKGTFVHFTERSSAEKAVEVAAASASGARGDESAMDGVVAAGAVQLQGCNLTVEIARPERERNNEHRDRGGPEEVEEVEDLCTEEDVVNHRDRAEAVIIITT